MNKRLSVSLHAAHRAGQSQRNGPIAAMPRPLILLLITALLGCALPALAAGESRPRSVLTNVPGLEKRVTYTETKIPLGELVAKVAAETGVPLTASRDVADEPVAVVVKEFSARELLEQLADLLDYRWSRRASAARSKLEGPRLQVGTDPNNLQPASAFEIWQDLASKNREEALRKALFGGMEQRFQENIAICLELAGESQEEIQRLWDEGIRWNQRLQKLTSVERLALKNSPEGRKARSYKFLWPLWSPIKRSLAGWTLRLPPEQWAAVRAGQALIYSSDPQRGELPLPPEVLRVFRTSPPVLLPAQRQEEQKLQERWSQAAEYRVSVRWGHGLPTPGQMVLWVLAQPLGGAVGKAPWQENSIFEFGLAASPDDMGATAAEDPRRRDQMEQDPVLSVKKPFQPDTRPYVDPIFPGASRTFRFLPELLPELARAYGVNFIADSYWMALPSYGIGSIAGTASLFEVLDRLNVPPYIESSAPFTWDRRGSLIRLRDRKWYLDRPAEIPLRMVRRWVAVTNRLGALPLAEFASAAATLSDPQIGLLYSSPAFPPEILGDMSLSASAPLERARYLLRLYGRLSAAKQQALWEGKPLAMAQLSPALRPLVMAQLNRIAHTADAVMDLQQWEGGSISFTGTPDVRIRERRGQSVTFRLESEPAPRANSRPDEVTRFPVTHLEMRIQYGPQQSYALRLLVAAEPTAPE